MDRRTALRLILGLALAFVAFVLLRPRGVAGRGQALGSMLEFPPELASAVEEPDPLQEAGRWEWHSSGGIGAVYSPDGIQVWAAGNGVWHSTDSGATWSRMQIFGTTTFPHVRMNQQGEGFVVGAQPKVYRTQNAGGSWDLALDNNDWAGLVEIADPRTVLVTQNRFTSSGELLHASVLSSWDSGASWTGFAFPEAQPDSIVAYLDTAWAFYADPAEPCPTYVSFDRGITWVCQELISQGHPIYAVDAAFGSATHGWLLGKYRESGAAFVWRTTDGGTT